MRAHTRSRRPVGSTTILLALFVILSPAPSALADTLVVAPGESIQAALDAAAQGDVVLVQGGEHRELLTITTPGVSLIGKGKVILDGRPDADTSGPVIRVTADNVRVAGLTIRNAVSTAAPAGNHDVDGAGILAQGAAGLLLEQLTITHCQQAAIRLENCTSATIKKVTLTSSFYGLETIACSDVVVSKALIDRCFNGTFCQLATDHVFTGCRVRRSECGIYGNFVGVLIEKSRGIDCAAFLELDGNDLNVVGNRADGGMHVIGRPEHGAVPAYYLAGNTITGSRGGGIDAVTADNLVCVGNTIKGSGLPGATQDVGAHALRAQGSGMRIEGNTLLVGPAVGLWVLGSGNTLTDNKVARFRSDGIRIDKGNDNILDGNVVLRCDAEGIEIGPAALGTTVTNNKALMNRIDFAISGEVPEENVTTLDGNTFGAGAADGAAGAPQGEVP